MSGIQDLTTVLKVGHELLRRSVAGVFAYTDPSGEVRTAWHPSAWPLLLGLAVRLQYECYRNLMGTDTADRRDVQQAVAEHRPIGDGDELGSAPIEALVAELYRGEGQWVVALRRHIKGPGSALWEGCLWNGSGLMCMGLAACLQRGLSERWAAELDERFGHDPRQPLERRSYELLHPLLRQNEFDALAAGGTYGYLALEANRLRERGPKPGPTLRSFLNGSPPDPSHPEAKP